MTTPPGRREPASHDPRGAPLSDETPEQEAIEEEAAEIDPRDDDAPEKIRRLEEEARAAGLTEDPERDR